MADSALPEIPLTPQAKVTDQFAQPEIRRRLAGNQLVQLAGALKEFSSDAAQVFDQRTAAYQQQAQMQADQMALSHEAVWRNQNDLKAAVARGDIPESANPWLMVRLRQDVARNEATTAQAGIYNDLRKSDVFHQDDPQAVSKFINDRFASLAQGRDAWSAAAMKPALDQAHARMMQQWTEQRGQERMDEARTAAGAALLQTVNNRMGDTPVTDPAAADKLPGLVSDSQQHYDHLLQVVDKATASRWISEAAFQAGRIHRSADLTRAILDGVKGQDGIKLSDLADNKANLEILPREVMELSVRDDQTKLAKVEAEKQLQVHTLWDIAGKRMKEQGLTDPWKVKFSFADMKDKMPEAWDEFQKELAASAAQAGQKFEVEGMFGAEDKLRSSNLYGKTFSKSGIDPNEQNDLLTHLMTDYGPGGRRAGSEYDFMVRSHKMGTFIWGSTAPQTHLDLLDKINDPNTNPSEFQTYLRDLATNRRISEEDFKWAASHIAERGTGGPNGLGESNTMQLRGVRDQIRAAFIDPNNPKGIPERDVDHDENYTLAIMGAEKDAENDLTALRNNKDFKAMTPDQQRAKIAETVDRVAVAHGGWTSKQLIEARRNGDPAEQIGLKQAQGRTGNPQPLPQAKPVEGNNKAPEKEPTSASAILEKFDPASKSLQSYQKTALANYFISPAAGLLGISYHGMSQYNEQITNIWKAGRDAPTPYVYEGNQGAFLTAMRVAVPDYSKYTPGDQTMDQWADSEIQQANLARQRITNLKPVAEAARGELEGILNNPRQPVPGREDWFKARLRVVELANYVEEYSTLRKLVGFTPAEVKAGGSDAWKTMPMFINPREIDLHGEEVATSLGIKDTKDKADFIAHQRHLTQLMRSQPLSE